MSHFSVAVFTDENTTVEDLLEPYWENLVVEKYVCMTKEELINKIIGWQFTETGIEKDTKYQKIIQI